MLLWRYIGHWYAPLERYLGQAIARARRFAYSSIPRCLHSPRQSSAHGTCRYRVAKNFRKGARRIGLSWRVYLRQVESKVHLIAVGPPLVLPFELGAEGAKVALKRQAAVCCVDDKVLINRDVAQKCHLAWPRENQSPGPGQSWHHVCIQYWCIKQGLRALEAL